MPTCSGTMYRRDNDKNARVESEQETATRSSLSSLSDTDSQPDNGNMMHQIDISNAPTVQSTVTNKGPLKRKMHDSYSTVVVGSLDQQQDVGTLVHEVNDGSSHNASTDNEGSDFSEPRLTACVCTSLPPRLETKPRYFGGWFEDDSSSEDNRYTFRSEPKQNWSDYSEGDDDLGDIPVKWIKREPKESILPEPTHNSEGSSLLERILDGLSGSIRERVMEHVEFVRKAEAGGHVTNTVSSATTNKESEQQTAHIQGFYGIPKIVSPTWLGATPGPSAHPNARDSSPPRLTATEEKKGCEKPQQRKQAEHNLLSDLDKDNVIRLRQIEADTALAHELQERLDRDAKHTFKHQKHLRQLQQKMDNQGRVLRKWELRMPKLESIPSSEGTQN
ncbi:hypothetical protein K439DRAFT_1624212 [Ramaria rubella]|nr:hypothetical protein K439DRAFT_1624212 [Ramaria rubella]